MVQLIVHRCAAASKCLSVERRRKNVGRRRGLREKKEAVLETERENQTAQG